MRRPLPAAALALLALTACDPLAGGPPIETREVERMTAELVTVPRGVEAENGGPLCVLEERTGGEYGKPRYVIRVTTDGRLAVPPGERRKVFYEVEVDAGGRRFQGLLTTETIRDHSESDLRFMPPSDLGSTFSGLVMSPPDHVGVQEVPGDLEACRLSIVEPDEPDRALGGRMMLNDDETVIVGEDGEQRSPALR